MGEAFSTRVAVGTNAASEVAFIFLLISLDLKWPVTKAMSAFLVAIVAKAAIFVVVARATVPVVAAQVPGPTFPVVAMTKKKGRTATSLLLAVTKLNATKAPCRPSAEVTEFEIA